MTNFVPVSYKKTIFLGLQKVSKKKRAHPFSSSFCLGYESDGWSCSSYLDNRSHILNIGQKNKMGLVLMVHGAAMSISEVQCVMKIK